jgi:two-component system response regulator BaeR
MKKLILIVEDEPISAALLEKILTSNGFRVFCINDGAEVLNWVIKYQPDLILMDIKLPNFDGITLCQKIREFSGVPMFFITSYIHERDKLKGLNSGADDYICKPYSQDEVIARIKAIFRRLNSFSDEIQTIADFRLKKEAFQAFYKNQLLDLTRSEFRILTMLLDKKNKVYSRSTLVEVLHDEDAETLERAVDGHIKNIRKKIKQISGDENVIKTIYGMGYKIIVE